MTNYDTLVKLQLETIGANFVISYSSKKKVSVLYLLNKIKRFESEDVRVCIQQAIEYIVANRVEHKDKIGYFTLHGK